MKLREAAPPSAEKKIAEVVDVTSTSVNVCNYLYVEASHVPFPTSTVSTQQSQYPLIAIYASFPRICEHAIQELKLELVQVRQLGWHWVATPDWSKKYPILAQRPIVSR